MVSQEFVAFSDDLRTMGSDERFFQSCQILNSENASLKELRTKNSHPTHHHHQSDHEGIGAFNCCLP
jgi:hypothetical protein